MLDDLATFACVARLGSFTDAAASLGTSKSNLSHAIRRLEAKVGCRLLQRNSRSVAPSEAGAELLATLEPALRDVQGALEALDRGGKGASGTLRLTVTRQAYDAVIRPALPGFADANPDVTVEVLVEYGFRDIVADRFDAGVRLGEKLDRDMVALKVGPDLRMSVVASPSYLARHGSPDRPADLTSHRCINYRMRADGPIHSWEFERDGQAFEVRVPGPLTFNEPALMLECALDGMGVAYVLDHEAASFVRDGRLTRLLSDWMPVFPGFHLYYPSRRQMRPALTAFVAAVRRTRSV